MRVFLILVQAEQKQAAMPARPVCSVVVHYEGVVEPNPDGPVTLFEMQIAQTHTIIVRMLRLLLLIPEG